MSQTEHSPEVRALLARHATACDLKMAVDRPRILERIQAFLSSITHEKLNIRFITGAAEVPAIALAALAALAARDARAAWAAWAARDARDARAAWAAWAARDARDARAAWAAWAAWAARDARDARAAWDAWAAWAARDARDARAAWAASWDLSWVSITAIGALQSANEALFRRWMPMLEAFEAGAFAIWFTATELVIAERPHAVRVDDRRRLHSADGYAFEWLDTIRDAYWHGVAVPEHVVMRPETITVAEIEKQTNAEVRRVMVERYGQSRYLIDAGAKVIHRDDYGTLYRKEIQDDEPIVMVKVVNSTAEPDGSFKDYFLRVPPTITRAREAVAWTFNIPEEEYSPNVQT